METAPALEQVDGVVERITFENPETGYAILKLAAQGRRPETSLVGPLSGVNPGESIVANGFWKNHPQYGRQFVVQSYSVRYPASSEGMRKFLASGLIRGVGPVTAARIVDHFKDLTLDVIENSPQRLKEIPGIGDRRIEWIISGWEEQKQIKEIMLFLQSHQVSTGLAVKIARHYGAQALAVLQQNPYRLAREVRGIGFKTADKIARGLGIALDAPERLRAGLSFTLWEFAGEGHCYALRSALLTAASKLLETSEEACAAQLTALIAEKELLAEEDAIYLPIFLHAEEFVASRLRKIQAAPRNRLGLFTRFDWESGFQLVGRSSSIQLTSQQRESVRSALVNKVSILTGGPGTGKSTITATIVDLVRLRSGSVLLAAPTGRAAKRLSEATGLEAKTIHRLLEFKPGDETAFARDRSNPLDADLIIIDESSMIDILLMRALVEAIEVGSHVLFIGDIDQLPSVGPGNVLRDLIESGAFPVTRLETIFRQSENSYIVPNAHRINAGEMPLFSREASDFFLFPADDPEKTADWVIDLVVHRIPTKFGLKPDDIQVLSPMHRGPAGVSELNIRLQAFLNPQRAGQPEIHHGGRVLRTGDRLLQTVNNYDLQVYNGDMGILERLNLEEQIAVIRIDSRPVQYAFSDLDQLIHAYAISVHKSQGSEYPAVVIPMVSQHFMLLQRNLLYTAVTRARKLVVLAGSSRAIAMAVHNNKISVRNTRLANRLRDEIEPAGSGQTQYPFPLHSSKR